jgi:ubiquinone/menaquinone biosynthesis C-methylase UbiE
MTTLTTEQMADVTRHNLELWNRCAPTYTEVFGPLTGAAADVLLDLAGVGDNTDLLDIGTGPGTLIQPALERGANVSAVDLAPDMVQQARTRHPELDVRVADGAALPHGDRTFDAVTLGFCLHHTANPFAVLSEAKRVLRPGGRLSLAVWAPADQLQAFGIAFTAVGESVPLDDLAAPQPPVIATSPEDYRQLLADSGFTHATARTLHLTWNLTDGTAIFDGFDKFLDLSHQTAAARTAIRQRLDQIVQDHHEADGVARLANPAIAAAARISTP